MSAPVPSAPSVAPSVSAVAMELYLAPHGRVLARCGWRPLPRQAGVAAVLFEPDGLPQPGADAALPAQVDLALLPGLRLVAHGTPPGHALPQGPFELEHGIMARTCAVRGQVLTAGMRVPLAAGDTIELGLLRLRFLAPPPSVPDVLPAPASAAMALAQPLDIHDALDAQAGAGPTSTGDPLLDELHRRYHALLLDPAGLAGPVPAGRTGQAEARAAAADPLVQTADGPPGCRSLRALLAAAPSVDGLIDRSDALGPAALLADAPAPGILQLFAPSPRQGQGAPTALASLTRREHHLPAADSALRLGGVEPVPGQAEGEDPADGKGATR